MISLSGIKKIILAAVGVAFAFMANAGSIQGVPPRPNPPMLVNNISHSTGFLSSDETAQLENKLENFAKATSNQIAIVILDTLYGYDIADFATEIGHQWQVGQGKFDNGIVVAVYLGNGEGHGKVFIAVGYGLEGAIPDATTEDIVQKEILPEFKQHNYYNGLNKATDVLMGLAKGEFNSDAYDKTGGTTKSISLILTIVFVLIVILIIRGGRGGRGGYTIGNSGIFFWGGGFGGSSFGGGGGGFGGGGGGFGGFGGGNFGGGGAGGSW